MAICPNCKVEARARKDSGCPNCGVPIMIYEGHWFADTPDSPPNVLINYLEEIINQGVNHNRIGQPVNFRIKRYGPRYNREVSNIKKMLEVADWDLELVKLAIKVYMTNKQFKNYNVRSFAQVLYEFDLALAIAQAEVENIKQESARLEALRSKLDTSGSIF